MAIDFKKVKSAYGTDQKLAVEGKWFPSTMLEGVKFKVAKTNNPNYEKMAQNLYRPHQDQIRRKIPLAPKVNENIQNQLIVHTLLLDWEGMPGEKNKEEPFSKEAALALISDPELKELKDELLGFSDNFLAFKLEQDEDLEGNLKAS